MADSKKYTVQEALNRVMNDADKSLNVKLDAADNVTISGTVDVALDSDNDSVALKAAVEADIATMQDDIALIKADIAAIKATTDKLDACIDTGNNRLDVSTS
tara:strand:- start:519 stop:824 length:306 start_codon:yes stop_codon:yes gene_type:complete